VDENSQNLFLKFCDVAAADQGLLAPDHDIIKALLGWAPKMVLEPHVNVAEIIAILKLVCAGAGVACPIIESM
jgi:hypothetical protein